MLAALAVVSTACGGGGDDATIEPTPSVAATSTAEPTPTGEPAPSPEPTPDEEPTAAPDPTATAAPTAVPEPPSGLWSAVQVDADIPNGSFWRELAVMALPDGRALVIYGSGTSLRMGTCVDLACSEVDVVEVFDTAPSSVGMNWLSAAVRRDGSPVILAPSVDLSSADPGSTDELRLVWCEDPDCAAVSTSVLPELRFLEPRLVASPDGRVGVFDLVATEPFVGPVDRFVGFTYCDDVGCLDDPDEMIELRSVPVDDVLWVGQVVGGFDGDGFPVALQRSVSASGVPQLSLIGCGDSECGSVAEPQIVVEGDAALAEAELRSLMAAPGGELMLLYQPKSEPSGGDITVTVCEDAGCSDPTSTIVLDNEALVLSPFTGALGADGRMQLAWSNLDGFVVSSCVDLACTEVTTGAAVPYRAPQIGMTSTADGAVVVATGEFREPGEPNLAPGVWLFRCADFPCTPREPPS